MRLLVTRPEPDASRTASALRARGHKVTVTPLMRVEMLPVQVGGSFDAILITSANAAHAATRFGRPVLTVGARSAQAAREAGCRDVTSADGALGDLVALAGTRFPGGRLLYLAGQDRAGDASSELAAQGIVVETVVVYRADAIDALPSDVVPANLDGVLHYSRRSAETLVRLAEAGGIRTHILNLAHYCLSGDVAAVLRDAGAQKIFTAASPTESALFMLI
jgi:uroporphyrinogen-III synthase